MVRDANYSKKKKRNLTIFNNYHGDTFSRQALFQGLYEAELQLPHIVILKLPFIESPTLL